MLGAITTLMMLPGSAPLDFPGFLLKGINLEILLRLGLAVVAGTLIGVERERHGRAAGLRTTLLVCFSSCIAMVISDSFYRGSHGMQGGDPSGWHPDPARLAAGVLTGMGFLGAGVIVRQSNHMVRGVTTAATLWFVTIIGLAFGAGAIGLGLTATAASLLILMVVPHVECRIGNDWYSDLTVSFSPSQCSVDRIVKALAPLNVQVKGVDLEENLETHRCEATFHLRYKRSGVISFSESIIGAVRSLPGILHLSFKS